MTSETTPMKRLSLSFVLLASTLVASAAHAQPTTKCADPSRPNLVYAAGSTALRPFLSVMAPLLAAETPPYTIVYQSQGSCTGVSAIFDNAKRTLRDVVGNNAVYYRADGTTEECSLNLASVEPPAPPPMWPEVNLGISDVFASSCGATAPAGVTIADFYGPIQPMTFVVPSLSKQTVISADAAYMAFGLGGAAGKAAPWTDPTLFFVRNASSGTQQMLARAVNVPAERWWGRNRGSATAVTNGLKVVLDAATAEKSLGILSTDNADAERNNLRILAFKARGQSCGYLPDSTPFAKDKANVRDGHYPIWGPVHLFARTSGGLPDAAAGAFVGRFATVRVDRALLDAIISRGLVPQCAMRVTRTEEMGPMSSVAPAFECGCYFDSKANGATPCKTCAGSADCAGTATPACNFGFCEAR